MVERIDVQRLARALSASWVASYFLEDHSVLEAAQVLAELYEADDAPLTKEAIDAGDFA